MEEDKVKEELIVNVTLKDGWLNWCWDETLHDKLFNDESNKELKDRMSKLQDEFAKILIDATKEKDTMEKEN